MNNIGDSDGEFKAAGPWFKCFPDDWLKGTRHLTLEQRGAYMDCLSIMYQTGQPLLDDDRWIACQLVLTPRRWRVIRKALIDGGKLIAIDGRLTNNRAEKEIEIRAKNSRTRSEISSKREQKKREEKQITNKIKEPNTKPVPSLSTDIDTDIELERDKPKSLTPEQDTARVGEEEFPHKVFVNCETIRHKRFTISLGAIEIGIGGRLSKAEVKTRCLAHALQWASEIEAGKLSQDVVPAKIANFLSASIMGEINRAAAADMRVAKFAPKPTQKQSTPHNRHLNDDSWKDGVVKEMMERGLINAVN